MSYAQAIPVCWICKKTSGLKVLETDQYGQAVHRECYFSIEALRSEGGLAMYVLPFRDTSVNPSKSALGSLPHIPGLECWREKLTDDPSVAGRILS